LAQIVAVVIAPVALVSGTLLQYVSFDYLWWVLAAYCTICLLRSGQPRWWLPIGAAIGFGMMTKYTMTFLAVGLAAGIGYIADPRANEVPVTGLLSPEYAQARTALIDPEHANCDVKPGEPAMEPGETSYLTVVDREGNIVSLIQSLANGQSSVLVDGMGLLLQNRGLYFSLDARQPTALSPRKRPSHTLIPALMENGDIHIGFGFVGGPAQAMAQMQFISNVVDLKMNLQAALEAPRFSRLGAECGLAVEGRIPAEVLEGLRRKGQILQVVDEYWGGETGMGQAVLGDSRSKRNTPLRIRGRTALLSRRRCHGDKVHRIRSSLHYCLEMAP
jgi:gamma-glutamyltranspeptidase